MSAKTISCFHNLVYWILVILVISGTSCTSSSECDRITAESIVSTTRENRSEGSIELVITSGGTSSVIWEDGETGLTRENLNSGIYCATVHSDDVDCSIQICAEIDEVPDRGGAYLDDNVTKILMIGNSHTFFNNLPTMLESILNKSAENNTILVKTAASGGWRFEDHATSSSTLRTIRSNNWDYVVLQENATVSSTNSTGAEASMIKYGDSLYQQIQENNSQTRIILYMTHAYENGLETCTTRPNVCTYPLMQDRIRTNNIELSQTVRARIAPAGIIWKILISQDGSLPLWGADQVHPSALGSIVSASVISVLISNRKLSNNSLEEFQLLPKEANLIIETINESIFNSNPDWRTF